MIFRQKPRFDLLDQYLAKREYDLALEAITEEIKRRPENFNLLLRQAEILGQAGDRERAIEAYRGLAKHYTDQGFFARAIAVTNKILRLDPNRQDVTRELASLMAAHEVSQRELLERRRQANANADADAEPSIVAHRFAEEPRFRSTLPPEMPSAEPPSPAQTVPARDESPAGQAEREREASRFFADFPQGALEKLLSSTCVHTFSPAEVIVREGEPGRSLFLIENGTVEVHTADPAGRRVVLAELGPGDFFGEVAVLTGRPRTATILAREAVTVIEITREDLEGVVREYPEVKVVLERFYRQRAHATVETMLSHLRSTHA